MRMARYVIINRPPVCVLPEGFLHEGSIVMPSNKNRALIQDGFISSALSDVKKKLLQRLKEKGKGTFASSHEIEGILGEEFDEFKQAVHDNAPISIRSELADIAVGCIFGIACIDAETMDWM